ncbi:MAG TPA: hypothetical protein VFL14_02765 [Xanthomonadales bacterium]|nr:hypothetical protein [Xanthomonadales bacterium]
MARSRWWLAWLALAALVALVYAPGFPGAFLLDDSENLVHVQRWTEGSLSFPGALVANQSGMLHRPLAMLSFLADAQAFGLVPGPMKATSVALHVACGLAIWFLLLQLFEVLAIERRKPIAFALAALWLLLPVHVSTVLYVVQRMTILSALFVVVALSCYVAARRRQGEGRSGALWLWIGFPLATVLAVAAKENGVLSVPLAFCLEITVLARLARPRSVWAFFALTLALPVAAALASFVVAPDLLLGSYKMRTFTLGERLLTESRILWRYVADVLLPDGRRMGLFHDDYPKSTGLFAPATTALATFAWAAVVALALAFRKRRPLLALGALFYLAGHSMESTVLPLELYFEHRNYLPAVGLLLVVAALLVDPPVRLAATRPRAGALLVAVFVLAYAGATAARSSVWHDAATLYGHALETRPDSVRLRALVAFDAMRAGETDLALEHLRAARPHAVGPQRAAVPLWELLAYCYAGSPPPEDVYAALERNAHGRIDPVTQRAFELLAKRIEPGDCPVVDAPRVVRAGLAWTASAPNAREDQALWGSTLYLARLIAASGDLAGAATIAERIFAESRWNMGAGVLAFQLRASLKDTEAQKRIVAQLRAHLPYGDLAALRAVEQFERYVASGGVEPPKPATTPTDPTEPPR